MRVNARDDLLTLEGLGDEVHGPKLESTDLVFRITQRRQDIDGRVASQRVVAQPGGNFPRLHSRHHDVEQNQGWLCPARDLDCVVTSACREQLVTTSSECLMQDARDSLRRRPRGARGRRQ